VLDPKSVADSICKIETELCYLHGLLAAEERGVAALQSGEAPSQQPQHAILLARRYIRKFPASLTLRQVMNGFINWLQAKQHAVR
jgi:hypothetical protein